MSRGAWPPPLEQGEVLLARGQPSLRRRLVETAWVAGIATVINTAIEAWQGTVTPGETATFVAVFGGVYLVFALYFRKGDHWFLTDRRLVLRRGSTLRAEEVESVTPGRDRLTIRTRRGRRWLVEPLGDPRQTAAQLNWAGR